jgi:hypothetical protein
MMLICFKAVIARLDRAIQRQKWIIRSSRIMTPFAAEVVLNNKRLIYKVLRLVVLACPVAPATHLCRESLFRRIPDKPE